MSKHTIELKKEELQIINILKAIMNLKSIDKTISFMVKDYYKKNNNKLIEELKRI
tara:strand:+ start:3873 stop:4037 length:165 start_codon:yes stop_codon:yes gene_type:complete